MTHLTHVIQGIQRIQAIGPVLTRPTQLTHSVRRFLTCLDKPAQSHCTDARLASVVQDCMCPASTNSLNPLSPLNHLSSPGQPRSLHAQHFSWDNESRTRAGPYSPHLVAFATALGEGCFEKIVTLLCKPKTFLKSAAGGLRIGPRLHANSYSELAIERRPRAARRPDRHVAAEMSTPRRDLKHDRGLIVRLKVSLKVGIKVCRNALHTLSLDARPGFIGSHIAFKETSLQISLISPCPWTPKRDTHHAIA